MTASLEPLAAGRRSAHARQPAAMALEAREPVSLVVGRETVARFVVDDAAGAYHYVTDYSLLRDLLFRMSVASLREPPTAVDSPEGPPGAAPSPRISDLLGWIGRALEDVRDAIGQTIESASKRDADRAWQPREFGEDQRAILRYGGSDAWDAQTAMHHLKLSRQGLAARRKAATILGLAIGPRRIIYPVWQFNPRRTDQLVEGLAYVLGVAPKDDPWGTADKLTSAQPSLGGRVPIDVLRQGGVDRETLEEVAGLVEEQ